MASAHIERTPSSNGNQKTWTWSGWIKINGQTDATYQYLMEAYYGNGYRYSYICFRQGTIETYGGDYQTSTSQMSFDVTTDRLLRDPSAWYHVCVAMDTTQATETNRLKIWINGEQQTEFQGYVGSGASATFPAQDDVTFMNVTTTPMRVGKSFDGSMAHVHFIDGTAYTASTFGETDTASGIWKPKTSPSVTYGTNGFFLKFENSGNMDLDSSGNNHTFATTGDVTQSLDTPSNNFCNLNPALPIPSGFAITNGKLSFAAGGSQWQGNICSIAPTKGKWYYECKYTTGVGIKLDITRQKSSMSHMATNNQSYGAYNDHGYGYQLNNSGTDYYCNNDSCTTWNSSRGNSTKIYMVAIDLDNGKYWIGADGTWFDKTGTANPATGADPLHSFSAKLNGEPFFITLSAENTGSTHHANFGQGYFGTTQVASANADANGFGAFEYAPPSGYYALCSKNLKENG